MKVIVVIDIDTWPPDLAMEVIKSDLHEWTVVDIQEDKED